MGRIEGTIGRGRRGRRWRDLGRAERTIVVVLGAAQLTLALVAWADLAERPAELVRGRKAVWAPVIAINVVGPVLYLTKGRRFPRVP